jgi:hypothetical protein
MGPVYEKRFQSYRRVAEALVALPAEAQAPPRADATALNGVHPKVDRSAGEESGRHSSGQV